ncbi:sensor histidine kinase [Desulfuribacillus alkaliarsenatis]|uniref:histidine kinase n=1 Tax=Desulfuribacillus alkaliarsenatis TaxID=766136 RepID=A0A1E5G4I5_9FIRM|nr:ATP-binding protein [Desulfuribacillus alkaliarsenatis]OEF98005.1 hypothetical protein BHF68_13150 [Desulfuribacillus alkaliarsenatis]
MMNHILDKQLQTAKDISTLLVRSPSCSCVLEDVLEMMVNDWSIKGAAIVVANNRGSFNVLASYVSTKDYQERTSLQEYILSNLEKSSMLGEAQVTRRELLLLQVPLYLQDKKRGCLCIIADRELKVEKSWLTILEIISNQASQALEKELEKEKTRYYKSLFKSVLEGLTEGIILTNNRDIIYSNKVAMNLIHNDGGLMNTLDEMISKITNIAVNSVKVQVYMEAAENNNSTYFFEIETTDRKFLRFTKFPISKDSSPIKHWGYLINDITKRKEADKIKDDLIATVSHELKTPLTSIKGNVSTLLREDVIWSETDRKEFLLDIYEESERLNDLIEKLLDISKINAGVIKLDKTYVTINRIVEKLEERVIKRYGHIVNRHYADNITYHIDGGTDLLYIDEHRVLQVLLNLIDNAIKYGPEDGLIEVYAESQGRSVHFIVRDQGPGIPEEKLKKIFTKYYRIDSDLITMGSGLGLAICKGFIEAHRGKIWAESTQGKGSAFHFILPKK